MAPSKHDLRQLFKSNQEENQVHTTSDGVHFWKRNHAEAHASSLENKAVVTTTREEAFAEESDAEKLATIQKDIATFESAIEQNTATLKELKAEEAALKEKLSKKGKASDSSPPAEPETGTGAEGSGEPSGKTTKNKKGK